MVEENLSVLQEAADIARRTYEKKTSPYQPEADLASVSTPAPEVQPTPVVTPAPVAPVVPTGPKPYEASDPSLVFYELNENPRMQDLNRVIYGEEMIDIVMDARASGRLDLVKDAIVPTPEVQMMMSASGRPAQEIGLYLLRKDDPVSLENLRGRIGEVKLDAIERAYSQYAGVTEVEEPKPRGWIGAVGNELANLPRELPIGVAGGLVGLAKNITETLDATGVLDPVALFTQGGLRNLDPATRKLVGEAIRKSPGIREFEEKREASFDIYQEGLGGIEDYFVDQLDTFTGNFTAGATEFIGGLLLAPAKVIRGSTLAADIANSAARGAIVDGVVYDDEDGNLTAFLKEVGWLESGLIVDLLAADEDDGTVEKVIATVAEGALVGIGIDALAAGVLRGIKAFNKGKVDEGLKLIEEGHTEMLRQLEQDQVKFLEDLRTDAEKIEAGEYVPDFDLVDPEVPYRPDFQLVDEAPTEAPKEAPTAKATKETKDTPAGDYQMPRPEAPESTVSSGEPFIEFNKIPGFDEPNAQFMEDFMKYVKFQRRSNDLDRGLLNRLAGVDDLAADLLYKDANQMREMIKDRVISVFGKIQQPKDRFKVIAMAAKVLEHHGSSFLAKDLRKTLETDVSKWSDEAAANLVASGVLQDMLQEQYIQVVSDIAAYHKGVIPSDLASRYSKMFPNYDIKDVDDLRMLKQAVAAKIGQLRVGNAKVASNAGRALRMIGLMKRADTQLAKDQMKIQWQKDQGMIDDRQEIKLLEAALAKAMKTKKGAAAVNDVIKAKETMGFWEAFLRATNANLLLGAGTQILMAGSNFIRMASEGLIKGSTGAMDVARAIRYWGNAEIRAEALQSASRNTRQGLLWYATVPQNISRFFKAYMRYWKRGLSDFDQRVKYDEEQTFSGMTLEEVFKQDPTKILAASEVLYRFMGSVDEAFKELVIMSDQQVRMATGEFGAKNQKPFWAITPEDIDAMLAKKPDAVSSPIDGRLSDIDSVEKAHDAMFLFNPVEGSARSFITGFLRKRTDAAFIFRILSFRFMNVPLAVMESRFMNVFAPIVLAQDIGGSLFGKGGGAKHWRVVMGKFADDLAAEGKEGLARRQRARGILALNTTLAGAAYMAHMVGGVDWINDDPTSPDYMKVRVISEDGTERWSNAADFESPLNAFLIHYAIGGAIKRGLDPTKAMELQDVGFAVSVITLNESLFKSSLNNMVDTLGTVADPNQNSVTRFVVNLIAPMNPGGWWQRKVLNVAKNNPFREENQGYDGRPVGFFEALAKQVPPFRLVTNGLRNANRNALGELIKPIRGVNPFLDPIQMDDPIIQELELIQAQTGKDFMRREYVYNNVKMEEFRWSDGQSVWDRAQHLLAEGEVKLGGYTLREELEYIINSREYEAGYEAIRQYLTENQYGPDGKKTASYSAMQDDRVVMISQAMNTYRRAAIEMAIATMAPEDRKRLDELMKFQKLPSNIYDNAYASTLEQ